MGCARPVAALREPSAAFGVSVSRMSVWRDVQESGRNARRKQAGQARGCEREVASAVMPSQTAGRSIDQQRDGARDKRNQDKAQDSQGAARLNTEF